MSDRARAREHGVDSGPAGEPRVGERHRVEPLRLPGFSNASGELHHPFRPIPLPVDRIPLEARARWNAGPGRWSAGQQTSRQRVVDGDVKRVLAREGEELEIELPHQHVVEQLRHRGRGSLRASQAMLIPATCQAAKFDTPHARIFPASSRAAIASSDCSIGVEESGACR